MNSQTNSAGLGSAPRSAAKDAARAGGSARVEPGEGPGERTVAIPRPHTALYPFCSRRTAWEVLFRHESILFRGMRCRRL